MLKEHEKLQLKTLEGQILGAEVNYNDSKEVKDCQIVKFDLKGETFRLKRDDLVNFLMTIGSQDDMKNLLPVKRTKVKTYETELWFEFRAAKAYEKGETVRIKAPHIMDIPDEEQIFSGNLERKIKIFKK